MFQSAVLLMALSFSPASTEMAPLTDRSPEGGHVVLGETLATAKTYRATFAKEQYPVPLTLRVQRAVAPEPFVILEADETANVAVVRTTELGGFRLTQNTVTVSPSVVSLSRRCVRAMAYLDLDPKDEEESGNPEIFAKDDVCPEASYADPLKSLILEGLSKTGERLWTTVVPDPRWRHVEEPAANGQVRTSYAGQLPVPVLYASFSAPIGPELERIAWHEITANGEIRKLGESAWQMTAQ